MRNPSAGASDELIAAAERALGIALPEELTAIWKTCNGLTLKRGGFVVHPLHDPSAPRETAASFVYYNTERRPPAMDASFVSIATDGADHLVLRRQGVALETEVRLWLHHIGTTRRYGGLDKILREARARARHVGEGKAGRLRREREAEANLALVRAVQSRDPARLERTLAEAAVVPRNNGQALIVACLALRADLLEILLRHGYHADATFCGMRPLNRICADVPRGGAEVAKVLLAHGADPNRRVSTGWGPLHFAAYNGDAELVEALLAGGADPETTTRSGRLRPLHLARTPGVVQALFQRGAQVNSRAEGDTTPLMTTALNHPLEDRVGVANALLDAGADLDAVDEHDRTALRYAVLYERWDLACRLLDLTTDIGRPASGTSLFIMTASMVGPGAEAFAAALRARGADVYAVSPSVPLMPPPEES